MDEILAAGVAKRFGRTQALVGVDLAVPRGALWALVGADGAGKTTLLRCLAGLYRPDAGHVIPGLAGQHRLGFAQQGFHLYPELTVDENLRFFGRIYGVPRAKLAARADELVSFAGLERFRDRRAGVLSGGMMQKLTLACSLIHSPPVLLLDEPTTGVDPVSRHEFWDLLAHLHAAGSTILLASAYFDEAERCDRVVYLAAGRVVAEGVPAQLRDGYPSLEDAFLADQP